MGVSKTSAHIQTFVMMPNSSQEPPAFSKTPNKENPVSFKAPNQEVKDMDILCNFKIKIESQNLDQGYIEDHLPYINQD